MPLEPLISPSMSAVCMPSSNEIPRRKNSLRLFAISSSSSANETLSLFTVTSDFTHAGISPLFLTYSRAARQALSHASSGESPAPRNTEARVLISHTDMNAAYFPPFMAPADSAASFSKPPFSA